VSVIGLRLSKGGLTAGQKSAEGILGHDVGKAFEELTRSPLRMNRLRCWFSCRDEFISELLGLPFEFRF